MEHIERVTITGDSDGGGYSFHGLDGVEYHGKPSLVGKHRAGDSEYVGFLSPGTRREPVILTGWDRATKRFPMVLRRPSGVWVQAEGAPSLDARPLDRDAIINWGIDGWDLQWSTALSGGVLSNPAYNGRGHVYWEDVSGVGWMAWGHWVEMPDGVWLAVGVARQIPDEAEFTTTYLLQKYDIENHSNQLAQDGSDYGGGEDHGSLSLHFTAFSNTLTMVGPLTHPTGRKEVFRIRLGATLTPFVKTTLTKPGIHLAVGVDTLLSACWSATGGSLYAQNVELQKLNSARTAYAINKLILVSDLVEGDDIIGCNPNNGRAIGRPAYDAATNRYYVWAAARTSGSKDLGSLDEYFQAPVRVDCVGVAGWPPGTKSCCTVEASPPLSYDQVPYDFFSGTRAALCAINAASGAISKVIDVEIDAIADTADYTDSLDWYEANVPLLDLLPGGLMVDEVVDRGWAREDSVASQEDFDRLLLDASEPILVHPLQARNDEMGTAAFDWAPPQTVGINQGPGRVAVSPAGRKIAIYSKPVPELYGIASIILSDSYPAEANGTLIEAENAAECCWDAAWQPYQDCLAANPYFGDPGHVAESDAWIADCTAAYLAVGEACDEGLDELAAETATIIDAWRLLGRRVRWQTRMDILGPGDTVELSVDISHLFTGLTDYYEIGPLSRDWDPREILDQVWQYHYCDTAASLPSAEQAYFEMVLLLRDVRPDAATASRPALEIRSPDGATVIGTVNCTPDAAANHYIRTPIMRHGIEAGGAWSCDVWTAWEDASGDCWQRVTQVIWGLTVDSYSVLSSTDFVWGAQAAGDLPTDAAMEGLAYVGLKALMQYGVKDLFRFP